MEMLLGFIFVVCEGDVDLMVNRFTSLTWLEEWFFYFEQTWGRSFTQWWQVSQFYTHGHRVMRDLFRFKLALVKRSRSRWPTWATYEEDKALRKPKWNTRLSESDGKKLRLIFWDMTGIPTYKFEASDTQRVTYSKYYAGNCIKGAVAYQL